MIPRTYQQRAVAETRAALDVHRRVCLVMPTGAGKTITARIVTEREDALWLVHIAALKSQLDGQGLRAVTVQSLLAGRRPPCSILVADEAHHLASTAPAWKAVADHYQRILGLTATPCRGDGAPLGDIFDHLVVGAHYSELLAGGWIAPCRIVRPVDLPEDEEGLGMHPIRAWERFAAGRRGFAFFGRVELAKRFAACIPRSATVTDEQPRHEREDILAAFERGELDVLASVACLSEGVDLPSADVAMLARGVSCEGSYLQAVGRVLRPAPGKVALLIDLPGASFRYGFPTDDREYSLSGQSIRHTDGDIALSQCMVCGAVYKAAVTCPECGWVRPPKVRPPRIWGSTMEEIDPSALTNEQRAKLSWKERMIADADKRLVYLQRRARHQGHAAALHRALFGMPLPRNWWHRFPSRN